jgi:hypothetical protein
MARITLSNLAHSYLANPASEADFALKEMDHVWEDGGAYALLGASGCGKTTLLNIISGLVRPSQGRVLFGDRDVTDAATTERNIAQVFQFPVVYDTMTVRDKVRASRRGARTPFRHYYLTRRSRAPDRRDPSFRTQHDDAYPCHRPGHHLVPGDPVRRGPARGRGGAGRISADFPAGRLGRA